MAVSSVRESGHKGGLLVAVVTGEPEALQDALEAALLTLAAHGAG